MSIRPTGRSLPTAPVSFVSGRVAAGGSTAAGKSPSSAILYAEARSMAPPPNGNLCNYSLFRCHGERISGFQFCVRHILSDKSAPFRPCTFTPDLQNQTKCGKPAPFYGRVDSYCAEHSKSIQSTRNQLNKKRKSVETILLDSLIHYKKQRVSPDTGTSSSAVDPFNLREEKENEGLGLLAIEHGSSQEDTGDCMISDTWRGEGDSDGDSADSEAEDCLQHAGVYTAEEVMRTMKDKLVKLQKLYIDQFQRIVHKMRESRRVYLAQLKAEKEAGLTNIFNQPKEPHEYERLKAMSHYYSPAGREALLAERHRERRLAALPGSKPPTFPRCQHTLTTTTKCSAQCVPMAKFCFKHILEEQGQVLYKPCGVVTPADGPCETPVPALFNNSTCVYHSKMPPPSSPPKDKKPEPANGQADSDKQKGKSTKNKDKKHGKSGKMKQAKSEELASKAGKDDINEENEIVVGKLAEDRITLSPIKEENLDDELLPAKVEQEKKVTGLKAEQEKEVTGLKAEKEFKMEIDEQSLSKEIKDESSVSSEGLVGRGEVKDEINSAEQTEKELSVARAVKERRRRGEAASSETDEVDSDPDGSEKGDIFSYLFA